MTIHRRKFCAGLTASVSVALAGCAVIDEIRGENYLEIEDLLITGPHDFDDGEKLEVSVVIRHSGRATMSDELVIEVGDTVVHEESIESDTRGTGLPSGTRRIPTTDLPSGTHTLVVRLEEFDSEVTETVDID